MNKYHIYSLLLLLSTLSSLAQHQKIDSLLQLESEVEGVAKIPIYNQLSDQYFLFSRDTAMHYQMRALMLAQKYSILKEQAHSHNIIGEIHLANNEYLKGLEYFKKAYRIAEKAGDELEMATSFNDMAVLFSEWEQHKKALNYYRKAEEIITRIGSPVEKSALYNNIAVEHIALENHVEAIRTLEKAMGFAQEAKSTNDIAYIYLNLAYCHTRQGQRNQAILNFQQSLKLYRLVNNHEGIFASLASLSLTWLELGQAQKAKKLANEMKSYQTSSLDKAECNYVQAAIADSLQNYKLAITHYKRYYQIKDSVFRKNKFETLSKISNAHENQISKKENADLKVQIVKEQLARAYQKKIITVISVLLLIMMALFLKILLQYKSNKKRNKTLEKKNKQIIVQNTTLKEQSTEIEQQKENLSSLVDKMQNLNQFKKDMSSMLVHDLKNPLNAVIGLSEIELDDKTKDNENWKLVNNSGRQILNLVNNILDVERFQEAKMNLSVRAFKATEIFQGVKDLFSYALEKKSLSFELAIQEGLKISADYVILERILINLISNAIKYSKEGDSITVRSYQTKSGWAKIEVRDYGEGIPSNLISKIFDRYTNFAEDTEKARTSTGLGLTFCKVAVEAHGGEISVESDHGHGALFWFTIPVTK